MTLGAALGVVLGLALGLLGPRSGRWLLVLLSTLLGTAVLAAWAGASGWSFLATALLWALLLAAVAGLWVRWPRAGLVPALLLALAAGLGPLLLGIGTRPSVPAIAVGMGFLVLSVWGVLRPALGLSLVSAALGARLVLWSLPGETKPWQWPLLALLLLGAGHLLGRRQRLGPRARRDPARAAIGAAALAVLAATSVALFTPELPAPAPGSRLERLTRLAPRGGYLWPALSETVTWEDSAGYRSWDNLDLYYLTGAPDRGVRRTAGSSPLLGRFSLNRAVQELRRIKEPSELADLAFAARAIVASVRATAPGRVPGVPERAVAESVRQEARAAGCSEDSFPPVVASGARAASIHASPTDAPLLPGEMVVVDVGCSVHHYASDFTRTFPVGGRFRPEHRRFYEAVYAAQQAALAACRPGAVLGGKTPDGSPALDDIAHRVLRERLGERGYSHGLGHAVGLFVHDGSSRGPLVEGMVITLEPGLYLPGRLGIRIEDTYRVTASGCEPLTVGLPADPDSVESFLAGAP
jgi:Xaa-Pro aminopeptidase